MKNGQCAILEGEQGPFGIPIARIDTQAPFSDDTFIEFEQSCQEFFWLVGETDRGKKYYDMLHCENRAIFRVGNDREIVEIHDAIAGRKNSKRLRRLVGMMAAVKFLKQLETLTLDEDHNKVFILFDKEPDLGVINSFLSRYGFEAKAIEPMIQRFGGWKLKPAAEIVMAKEKSPVCKWGELRLAKALEEFDVSSRSSEDYLKFIGTVTSVLKQGEGLSWDQVKETVEAFVSKREWEFPEDIEKLRHMIGADSQHPESIWGWRNYYAPGPFDVPSMKRLEAAGLVRKGQPYAEDYCYHATEHGKALVHKRFGAKT